MHKERQTTLKSTEKIKQKKIIRLGMYKRWQITKVNV